VTAVVVVLWPLVGRILDFISDHAMVTDKTNVPDEDNFCIESQGTIQRYRA
jgi:hypothetical protein